MNLLIRHKRRLRSIAGFTLIEMLVILIIIGILFAIAAPGWDAFVSRQRVTTAREQVVLALKQAQTTAKTSKVPQIVAFRNSTDGFPEFSSGVYIEPSPAQPTTPIPNNWQRLGENKLPANSVEAKVKRLTATAANLPDNSIVFDTSGAVAQYPLVEQQFNSGGKEGFLKVTVGKSPLSSNTGSQRCAIVKTLLGSIQQAEGATDCS
jgi:prepilin-type N-terminal cleavage/methylation domain-containing protein